MEKLKLNIQMFADGEIVIKTTLDDSGFKNGLNKMENSTAKMGSSIKNIVAGLGISSIIGKAVGMINNSLDGAISRFDTLNNFPKVMTNLGISAEEADKSIKKMSKKLTGLPTTIDDAALSVQRFTSANGDIKKSTDMFLALNNAIIAGGAGTQIQQSALEQLTQSYSKGKMDMMEWRTIQMAMPAQLKQVASAMGVTTDELGVMLREGDNTRESMDKFFNTIMKLNTQGLEGFASFSDQAQNAVGGIGTSITNAKTAITRGVTKMITSINKGLKKANLPSIAEIITNLGKSAEDILGKVGEKIPIIIEAIQNIINILDTLKPVLISIGAIIVAWQIGVFVQSAITGFQGMMVAVSLLKLELASAGGIMGVVKLAMAGLNAVMLANPIALIVAGIALLIAGFVLLWNKCEWFRNFWIGLWQKIKDIVKGKIGEIIGTILTIKDVVTKMADIGKNIVKGIWEGISSAKKWIKDKIKEWVGNVTDFLKETFKIGSPSKLMRDEIGIYLAQGVGVGFEQELDGVYNSMQRAINLEQAKLQANVETGKVFNSLTNATPIVVNTNATVEMDSQKVGRLITPAVSRTLKTGGAY